MSISSDPRVRAVDARLEAVSAARDAARVALEPVRRAEKPARTPMQRLAAYGVALAASAGVLFAFGAVTTWMAEPLVAPRAGAAPAWSIEVTSASGRPATVLVYGKEAGVHLVRVPAADSPDDARIVPARLARGEVHLVSLSFTSLRAHASSPRGMSPMSWTASAPIITAFDGPSGTGVRTFW